MNIYKVDVIAIIKWFKRERNELPEEVVQNFWTYTNLIDMGKEVLAEIFEDVNISQLEKQVRGLVPPRQRMSIARILNHGNEDDFLEEEEENINAVQYKARRSRRVIARAVVMLMTQLG